MTGATPLAPPLTLDGLDAAIEARLVGNPTPSGRRLVGLELERLILHRQTSENAPLAFCRNLLAELVAEFGAAGVEDAGVLAKMRAADFGISMEPGGQLEFDTDPCPDIASLEEVFTRVTSALEQRLATTEYRLAALGHAPVTPVDELGLLPRPRYRIMDAEMTKRGELTRNMMRATAGLQVTCDFRDRADAGRRLALLNRLSPVLMAMSANSRMVAGRDSGFASFRHRVWWDTDHSRVGVPVECLDAATAVDGYRLFARRAISLFVHGDAGVVATPAVPFEQLVAAGGVSDADLDLHLSSLFPFVRLRNYLEIRCFDTVEWPLAKGLLALVSPLVYCATATAQAESLSQPLAIRDVDSLRELHLDAARQGLDAVAPDGRRLSEYACELASFAAQTIGGPGCDWARPGDLDAITALVC